MIEVEKKINLKNSKVKNLFLKSFKMEKNIKRCFVANLCIQIQYARYRKKYYHNIIMDVLLQS